MIILIYLASRSIEGSFGELFDQPIRMKIAT